MSLKTPEFMKQPDLIWPFLRSLFATTLLDYLLGLVGALSVASIAQISFDLDFGPMTDAAIEFYRRFVEVVLEPMSRAIIWLVERVAPNLHLNLILPEAWKDGIVLLGIYYQKHGRNEAKGGRPVTAIYQFAVGIVIAISFGLAFNAVVFPDAHIAALAFVAAFATAILTYDTAFLLWATAFLRKKFAEKNQRPVEQPWSYFQQRFIDAFVRVGAVALVTIILFAFLSAVWGDRIAGEAITFMMLLIGLAWASRGLRMASEKQGTHRDIMARYKTFPAGLLGSAVVFPIVLGYVLTLLGVSETAIGATIELIFATLGF